MSQKRHLEGDVAFIIHSVSQAKHKDNQYEMTPRQDKQNATGTQTVGPEQEPQPRLTYDFYDIIMSDLL